MCSCGGEGQAWVWDAKAGVWMSWRGFLRMRTSLVQTHGALSGHACESGNCFCVEHGRGEFSSALVAGTRRCGQGGVKKAAPARPPTTARKRSRSSTSGGRPLTGHLGLARARGPPARLSAEPAALLPYGGSHVRLIPERWIRSHMGWKPEGTDPIWGRIARDPLPTSVVFDVS